MSPEALRSGVAALVALVLHGGLLAWPTSAGPNRAAARAAPVLVDTLVVPETRDVVRTPVIVDEPKPVLRRAVRERPVAQNVPPPREPAPTPALPPPPSNAPGAEADTPVVSGPSLVTLDTGPGVFVVPGNTDTPGFDAEPDAGAPRGYLGGSPGGLGRRGGGQAPGAGSGDGDRPLTRPPAVLREVRPVYPAALVDAHHEGSVRLRVEVRADGQTGRLEVVQSQGAALDAVASTALKGFLWRPAEIDGRPVTTFVLYDFVFELTD